MEVLEEASESVGVRVVARAECGSAAPVATSTVARHRKARVRQRGTRQWT